MQIVRSVAGLFFSLVICAPLGLAPSARADDQDVIKEMRQKIEKLDPALERAQPLLIKGKLDEANRLVLGAFPEATRTPVEALVLGNTLYKHDANLSYTLHKFAAEKLPGSNMAQIEWGMEQHRAREYAGAASAYRAELIAKSPRSSIFALAAECAIRQGNLQEACDYWVRAEEAKGTIEQTESMIFEVNGKPSSFRTRAELIEKVGKGDQAAAADLLAMDLHWITDWWNVEPNEALLKNDLALVRAAFPAPDKTLASAICAAEVALKDNNTAAIKSILKRHKLMIDPEATLPPRGDIASFLLGTILNLKIMTKEDADTAFFEKLLALGREKKDAEAFNAACSLVVGAVRLEPVAREALTLTGDVRFAQSVLTSLLRQNTLKIDSPELIAAVKQFPEDSIIRTLEVGAATKAGKVTAPLLADAIKAEFTKLSVSGDGGLYAVRPRLTALRSHFKLLNETLNKR